MTQKTRIQATFPDGAVITRKTARTYSHTWRVVGHWNGKDRESTGFSGSLQLAQKAIAVYTAPSACWTIYRTEIAEVRPA